MATEDAAQQLLKNLFFDPRRYDMAVVGRYKVNKKLGLSIPVETRYLTVEDITTTIGYILKLIKGEGKTDVIDHLGNRRLRVDWRATAKSISYRTGAYGKGFVRETHEYPRCGNFKRRRY